ncbi:hypothetical protein IFM46972_10713 [Aspergillus udagawae]|uniref:Uncharacterized protein n=1 Tax=Aspergillus udagawae TaxID=91492 RepID=A0A8H3SDK7_9EURO|nr:hypothetical protein IFM46972_10713 [Aspergillus udagawae]
MVPSRIRTLELDFRAVTTVIAGWTTKDGAIPVLSFVETRHCRMRGSAADHSVLETNIVVVFVGVLHTRTVAAVERNSSTIPTVRTTGATDKSYRALVLCHLAMAVGDSGDEEGKRDASDQSLHDVSLSRIKQINECIRTTSPMEG